MGGYHLLDAVEALPVETEGLFKQDSVLHRPLIGKRGEVRQVCERFLNVVFVPEEHPQSLKTERQAVRETGSCQRDSLSERQCLEVSPTVYLLHVVAMFVFGDGDVLVHWKRRQTVNM